MADIKNTSLLDLVPENLAQDENIYACSIAIDPQLKSITDDLMTPAIFSRINSLTSKQLDHLAWQFDSKVWRDSWPLSLKQSVIRTVITEKSKKGTLSAVRKAIESLGSAAIIREWWELGTPGDPYTFEVIVSLNDFNGQVNSQTQNDLIARIDDVKPVRSHYTLSIATQASGGLNISNGIRAAVHRRLSFTEA